MIGRPSPSQTVWSLEFSPVLPGREQAPQPLLAVGEVQERPRRRGELRALAEPRARGRVVLLLHREAPDPEELLRASRVRVVRARVGRGHRRRQHRAREGRDPDRAHSSFRGSDSRCESEARTQLQRLASAVERHMTCRRLRAYPRLGVG